MIVLVKKKSPKSSASLFPLTDLMLNHQIVNDITNTHPIRSCLPGIYVPQHREILSKISQTVTKCNIETILFHFISDFIIEIPEGMTVSGSFFSFLTY